jgi:adenylate cyclase
MDRQRMAAERARNNLSRYFSPNIVELLASQDEPLGAGRRETVAVLFADIVAFTQMSELMAPEDVLAMLREFHARMTAQIFAGGGTVDQYLGDGIVAVFGAPAASPNDAANALYCAEMMLDTLERWNHEREGRGDARLDIGIGLNYGPVVLGDVGSEHSMSFTAIGDTVNTAARLQVLTRALKTPLVVGDPLVQAIRTLSPEIAAERVGQLEDRGEHNLRGRASPVRIWTSKVKRLREAAPLEAVS